MELQPAIAKMMLSIKLEEIVPPQYHYYIRDHMQQIYVVGWEQGRLEINQHGNKPLGQYTRDGKLINTYKSLKDASRKTGFSEKGIYSSMVRNTPMKQGWTWKYLPKSKKKNKQGYCL